MNRPFTFFLLFFLPFSLLHATFVSPADSPAPGDTTFLFSPLRAPAIEASNGVLFFSGKKQLRLDIGGSVDLVTWSLSANDRMTVGADFFTWTSLREDENFHFPVDAVDYLFGINASWARPLSDDLRASGRLRWSHISAHMVDGRFVKERGEWKDGQLPRVYSREYVEVIGAVEWKSMARVYAGMQVIYHIDPAWLGKTSLRLGMEVWRNAVIFPWIHVYAAYDLQTVDIHAVTARHTARLGLKWGSWQGRGVSTFLTWFSGYSVHGEYFDHRETYWGPGLTVDL